MQTSTRIDTDQNLTTAIRHLFSTSAETDASLHLARFLRLYRWATLAVPVFVLFAGPDDLESDALGSVAQVVVVLVLAVAVNMGITAFGHRVSESFSLPGWLALDLVWMAGVLLLTGAEHSPFVLHTFTPVFAASVFFGVRGGLVAGLGYGLLLVASALAAWPYDREPTAPLLLLTYAGGLPLVSILIGTLTQLWRRTQEQATGLAQMSAELAAGNQELLRTNRQLALLRRLTLALEEAVDPEELQEQLLAGLVDELGYQRAVVALYDPAQNALTGWLSRGGDSLLPVSHTVSLALPLADSPVEQALTSQEPVIVPDGQVATGDPEVDGVLAVGRKYIVCPLSLRGEIVGLLLVDWSNREALAEADLRGLDLLTHHAGVVLGSLRLCIGRAQNLAVSEERTRIASDIHDTVSQSLFGLAYGLNACTEMLPSQPPQVAMVKEQLGELQPLVFDALQQIRGVVMDNLPGELTRESFQRTLEKQLSLLTISQPVALGMTLPPQFDGWPTTFRQQLLLITYEGLANVARHAQATHAEVVLDADDGQITLTVSDDGQGFPAGEEYRPGVGMDSIRRRVEGLGGELIVESDAGAGTRLTARLPWPC